MGHDSLHAAFKHTPCIDLDCLAVTETRQMARRSAGVPRRARGISAQIREPNFLSCCAVQLSPGPAGHAVGRRGGRRAINLEARFYRHFFAKVPPSPKTSPYSNSDLTITATAFCWPQVRALGRRSGDAGLLPRLCRADGRAHARQPRPGVPRALAQHLGAGASAVFPLAVGVRALDSLSLGVHCTARFAFPPLLDSYTRTTGCEAVCSWRAMAFVYNPAVFLVSQLPSLRQGLCPCPHIGFETPRA